tara:strand:+ start:24908 stop:26575 length:1668 start_codon:yes stop_codon:yes gene_type:complete
MLPENKIFTYGLKIFKKYIKKSLFLVRVIKFIEILILRRVLVKQISFTDESSSSFLYSGKKVLIPIVETSHYQHHHILALGKALQLRGAEVKVLLCDEFLLGCELKSVRNENDNDPCYSCRLNKINTTPLYGLKSIKLSSFFDNNKLIEIKEQSSIASDSGLNYIYKGINVSNIVNDSVIRYFYGALPKDKVKILKVRSDHAFSAIATIEIANIIDTKWKPDVVLCNMAVYSSWEGYYKYFKINGDRYKTISLTQFDFNKISFNWNDIFISNKRFEKYCKYRKSSSLNNNEYRILNDFLQDRFKGKSKIFITSNYYNDDSSESIKSRLKINLDKRNIFLFSNVYWDIGLSDFDGLYNDVITWVTRTIQLLDGEDVNLYIKPHPAEKYDTSSSIKSIREIINENLNYMPNNVFFINPEFKIKPYDLFPFIDLGIIFSGTLGLEMVLSDLPVVATGKTPYSGLGFIAEPSNEDEYKKYLIAENKTPYLDKNTIELFAYFYFIRSKIPWNLTNKAFGERFKGFSFNKLDQILPGKNPQLDHLCKCIMNNDSVPEAWPD